MSRTKRHKSPLDTKIGNRDGKNPFKPNKSFKKAQKASRKAKEKQSFKKVINGQSEIIAKFRKTDTWEWN